MKKNDFHYTKEFDETMEYTGKDLGVCCADDQTTVKIWAPFAERVWLYLYEVGGDAMELDMNSLPSDYAEKYELVQANCGVWQYSFSGNMHGTWYDFVLEQEGRTIRTADPYAKACSCNGCRSMMVDLEVTNPAGFIGDKAPERQKENIIYELHIQDFSMAESSGVPEQYRGKYKAFTVQDSTCMKYLKSLGITHVHLLPFFDFGWLDEVGREQFNWGYDPLNYNVPEGSYATDTRDGTVRIRECKAMIQALHKAGIRVVMDVVYNHTHEAESFLERTAKGYYTRRNEDGSLANGSACGNDLATGRAMVDNYIVNSVLYWAKEYHIDGFRFDLMGLLTTELMNRIRSELDLEFGPGEKLMYGEPWRASESPMEENTHPALKKYVHLLDDNIAVFSDDTRDGIKGDVFFADVPGFVNGGKNHEEKILAAVKGWQNGEGEFQPRSCNQIVNYVSAHDNLTLWDKLLYTVDANDMPLTKEEYLYPKEKVVRANKLAALIYFTCQGHLFFQAGEEFGRTKFGDENSFRSPAETNVLRWEQAEVFADLVNYYKGLIRLRKKLPGLYDKTQTAATRIYGENVPRKGVVSFLVDNTGSNTSWKQLFIVYNASGEVYETECPEGDWTVLANGEYADCCIRCGKLLEIPEKTGLILGRN